ncbi:MAG: hypothetical protein R3B70_27450 [Polyangiaceae bacterium]
MVTPAILDKEAATSLSADLDDDRVDPVRSSLAKAGTLLLDLSDQAMKLGVFIADHDTARTLAGSLCRRAELTRHLGRRLAISYESEEADATTLLNDAILALDGVAVDVEYAAEVSTEAKIKNQVARSRLAVTMAGCAIDDTRRVLRAQA